MRHGLQRCYHPDEHGARAAGSKRCILAHKPERESTMLKAKRVFFAFCLLLFCASLTAQTVTSSLLGTVNDPTASSVPGAEEAVGSFTVPSRELVTVCAVRLAQNSKRQNAKKTRLALSMVDSLSGLWASIHLLEPAALAPCSSG